MAFDAGLTVVERLDGGEAAAVDRAAVPVDVGPAARVAGAGEALVEDVEVEQPAAVQRSAVLVDVTREAVVALDHRDPVAVVAGVTPAGGVGRATDGVDVMIAAVLAADGAAPALEVAAPVVAGRAEVATVGVNVVPAVAADDGGAAFVEAECGEEAAGVGGAAGEVDVPGVAAAAHGGEAGRVELEDDVEALGVERDAVQEVMGSSSATRDAATNRWWWSCDLHGLAHVAAEAQRAVAVGRDELLVGLAAPDVHQATFVQAAEIAERAAAGRRGRSRGRSGPRR